jgi:predicted dehydrogenase
MTRVAIVGRGWGKRAQEPNFKAAGLEVTAVGGRDSWRELVQSDADVISVTLPPRMHAEIALAALEAGKHVICEKPMAMSVAEAESMVRAAEARPQQIAIIDHELRFVESFRVARERLPDLGPLRYVETRYSSPSRGDRTRPRNWWSDASEGGGVWGAVGSHFVDALHYFGMRVEKVRGTLRTMIEERSGKRVTSDDFANVELDLAGGALAVMTFSAVSAGPDEQSSITIHGEDASFRLLGEELLFAKRGDAYQRIAGGEMAQRPGNSRGGAFGTGTYELARALKRALDHGDRGALAPAATFADGLAVQRVLDAARASGGQAILPVPR